jgi:hypothetical protein
MKKITHLITSFILIFCISACAGYEPIFSSTKLQFKIADYSIKADKKLGNQIYSHLYTLAQSNKNNADAHNFHITIEASKDKTATVKNSAGKILEYKVTLSTSIIIKDFLTNDEILNQYFTYSSPYKVQDQHSETRQLENKTIDNLINKTYQDLLIKMSESISTK